MDSTWSPQFSGETCNVLLGARGELDHAHSADEPHLPGDPAGRGEVYSLGNALESHQKDSQH